MRQNTTQREKNAIHNKHIKKNQENTTKRRHLLAYKTLNSTFSIEIDRNTSHKTFLQNDLLVTNKYKIEIKNENAFEHLLAYRAGNHNKDDGNLMFCRT